MKPKSSFDPVSIDDIQELLEAGCDGGELLGYYCRGHVPYQDFAECCNSYNGVTTDYDVRFVRHGNVLHVWWRTVPVSGEPGMHRFVSAEPGSRGAWKATVADVVQQRRVRDFMRSAQEYRSAHDRGFRAGVDWALRILEIRDPQAVEGIVIAFRANGEAAIKADLSKNI